MNKEPEQPAAQNPEKFSGLKLGEPYKVAAGVHAVVVAGEHVFGQMPISRGMKALFKLNQKLGYDCPSCAWPDPDDDRSSIAEYCENGAKAVADEAMTKSIKPPFFAENTVADLAKLDDYHISKSGRIAQPMYLPEGATHYQPISWDDAFKTIASHLNGLQNPNEAIFYTSGRTSNEAAYIYQLFTKEYGTNNLPDCSNMCHESTSFALAKNLGIGKGSVKLQDFYEAEVIVILGQNPGTNHPRMLTALQKGRANGAKIVSVNPLHETGLLGFSNPQKFQGVMGINTRLTDIFLQVKVNGDLALIKAIELLLLEEEEKKPGTVFDHDFITEHTSGYLEFISQIKKYELEYLAEVCGISIDQIREVADLLAKKSKIIVCWAMGITQHKNAVDTIYELVNLLLLKGSIGKPGAGTCPTRGHSNVQGDRTVGIFDKPHEALLDQIKKVYGFEPPREHGLDVVNSIKAMYEGKAKVFFGMGGNFLSATPDTNYTAEALRNCDLTVHVSTKLNRSHLVHGKEALILPCLGRTDLDIHDGITQFVSCENSMGVVQMSKGVLKPVSDHLLSEPVIVCRLAKATFGNRSVIDWDKFEKNYDYIRDDIEKVVNGFEQYNQKVRVKGGFYLPNGTRERKWDTLNSKANFNVTELVVEPLAEDELLMMSVRSHDQFNTTIYGMDDRYRGIFNERRVIFMNPADIIKGGFEIGEVIDIYNNSDGRERVAKGFIIVSYDIPRQCVATYYPETNVLVPISSVADKSNQPASKSVVVKLRKSRLFNQPVTA
ncbi:FdhF/YdeP family oxidoreductase [Mucilaginibacter arboris]|uniref:FdhF/YdeP family oxidoreductase n=1 Tax=Mucilaginibacter arboris TaxID=2682090 RepID=A0A7K1SYD6_9SPHI|nr:FdhF/YdeP family oxidoreductase [Mucilaginibacter arboris]MVN22267.1 FdhF/YdeP family oxidoreductase [Mucilaginibacter arboris]